MWCHGEEYLTDNVWLSEITSGLGRVVSGFQLAASPRLQALVTRVHKLTVLGTLDLRSRWGFLGYWVESSTL